MIAQLNGSYLKQNPGKLFPRLLSYFLYEGRPATTRGRWFNPVTFAALRSVSHFGHNPGCEQPVFITGTGRSGSTILGMVLSMQKEIGFLNEPKALWYVANRYDDLIGSYSDGAAKYLLDAADATSEISACVKSIYSSFLKFSGSKRILDKFPEMIFRIGYLEQIFSDAKYIFLYRNPWDTISSTALWSAGHTNTAREENWWGVRNRKWKLMLEQVIPNDPLLSAYQHEVSLLKSDYDKAAAEWIVTMNQGLKMYTRFPEKIMLVQYEKLCMQPRKVLSDICRFAALQPDENMYRYGEKVLKLPAPAVEADVKPFLEEGIMRLSERLGYSASAKVME